MSDHSHWSPTYIPPDFEITNIATGDGAAEVTMKYSNIQLIKKVSPREGKGRDGKVREGKGQV